MSYSWTDPDNLGLFPIYLLQVAIFHKRDVALNARNSCDEMTMQFINVEEDGGLLPALQKYFKSIIIPQISKYDKWGPLVENKQGTSASLWFDGE